MYPRCAKGCPERNIFSPFPRRLLFIARNITAGNNALFENGNLYFPAILCKWENV
jgi:hypothetical protein